MGATGLIYAVILCGFISCAAGSDEHVQDEVAAPCVTVRSIAEYNAAQVTATAGDVIVWANGEYDINGVLSVTRDGITLRAETDGGVILTGKSQIKIIADNITMRGFRFRNGNIDSTPTGANDLFVVGNGRSSSSATINATKGSNNRFELMEFYNVACRQMVCITPGASHNLFEYCSFEAKPKIPANSVFQIQVSANKPGYNTIRQCIFKNFVSGNSGDYGMEVIRIGYSHQKDNISRDVIEYCYFYRCGGDDEIVSVKATETVCRYNTFDDNGFTDSGITYKGHLSIRHGHRAAVYGNFFLRGRGVRISEGGGHAVYNNYFNTGNNWALRIDNRNTNSGLGFADPVENLIIVHNTFTGCAALELHSGDIANSVLPTGIVIANNIFHAMTSSSFTKYQTGNESYEGNILYPNVTNSKPTNGLTVIDPQLVANADGYMHLQTASSPAIDRSSVNYPALLVINNINTDAFILLDAAQNIRPADRTNKDVGCFEFGGANSLKPYNTGTQ